MGAQVAPISIKGGYFLSDKWVIGTELRPNFSYQPNANIIAANISIDPYIRYYFSGKEGLRVHKFHFFADYNFSYNYGFSRDLKNKVGGYNYNLKTGIAPGFLFLVTDRVSVDAAIRLGYYGLENPTTNRQFATNYEIGMQIYLKGKKKRSADVSEMRSTEL